MSVKRIVANFCVDDPQRASVFYQQIFGLELQMDLGWIITCGNDTNMPVQVSFAKEGGSGTEVPDLSIEVDNLAEVLQRVKQNGIEVEYGPVTEPWGVMRFYVRDPYGRMINVLQHL